MHPARFARSHPDQPAFIMAGIIYTAMSTRLTVGEAAYIVENCEARLLITSHAMRGLAQELLPHTAPLDTRLMLDGVAPECAVRSGAEPEARTGYTAFEDAIASCPVTPISDETAGGDMRDVAGPLAKQPEAELIAFCRDSLSPIKCPRSIDFEAELPRHPTGKLYKRLLRDRYWAGRASKII